MTEDFRQAQVDEYILIGDIGATGTSDSWEDKDGYQRESLWEVMDYQLPAAVLSRVNAKTAVVSFIKEGSRKI